MTYIRNWLRNSANRGCLALVLALGFFAFVASSDADQLSNEQFPQENVDRYQLDDEVKVQASFLSAYVSAKDTLAQWIMAMLSAFATGVSVWAVILLRDTLKATREAVNHAEEANSTTEAMVELNEANAQRQLRAYVTLVSAEITRFAVGESIQIELKMKNCGQTPAYDYRGGYFIQIMPTLKEGSYELDLPKEDHTWSRTVLGPGIETSTFFKDTPVLSWEDRESIRTGKSTLYLWGIDEYTDAFNTPRRTWFRYEHTGHIETPQRMLVSPKGNGAT